MTTIKLKNGSGAPTSGDLVQGEPALDLTNKRLYTEDSGGTVIEVGTNPGVDVTFADNRKAIFGAGSDLQIYHDGSNSYIVDNGTGDLLIRAENNLFLKRTNSDETYLSGAVNGAVTLFHNNNAKIATTITGIDVTGTAVTDGLTSAGDAAITGSSSGSTVLTLTSNALADTPLMVFERTGGAVAGKLAYEDTNTAMSFGTTTSHELKLLANNTRAIQIDSGGDISFYEDTGTTAKLVWKSSDERLGIGTSSPQAVLDVNGSYIILDNGTYSVSMGQGNALISGQTPSDFVIGTNGSSDLVLATGAADRLHIDSSGNVGIGTSSPSSKLDVQQATAGNIVSAEFDNTDYTANNRNAIKIRQQVSSSGSYSAYLGSDKNTGNLFLANDSITADHFVINPSGNVGIGVTDPAGLLEVFDVLTVPARNTVSVANQRGLSVYQNQSNGLLDTTLVYGNATSSYLAFGHHNGTSYAERMRIDSSGSLLFNGNGVVSVQSNSSNFYLGGGSYSPSELHLESGALTAFKVNGSERMRIDSSGNLLVGKTSENTTTVGIQARADGLFSAVKASAESAIFGRNTDDGNIVLFRKDGTTKGAIGTDATQPDGTEYAGANLYIGAGDAGLGFTDDGDLIYPYDVDSNTPRDGTITLGHSSARFKDLYLSGTINLSTADNASNAQIFVSPSTDFAYFDHPSNGMIFRNTSGVERMRLDSSGFFKVNTTDTLGRVSISSGGNTTGLGVTQSSSTVNHTGIAITNSYVTGSQTGVMIRFIQTSGATVGTIESTVTATAYNTSSDQRLKDNIVDAPSASDDIDAIQVRSFDWKADGSHQKYGMVAQELQSVAPEAVSGDADSDDMMGVDYSKLVPMMLKEIQSLRARVAQLEGEN